MVNGRVRGAGAFYVKFGLAGVRNSVGKDFLLKALKAHLKGIFVTFRARFVRRTWEFWGLCS